MYLNIRKWPQSFRIAFLFKKKLRKTTIFLGSWWSAPLKTSTFHPQSNGSLERAHRLVKDLIITAMEENHNDWDDNLKLITMGYNTSVHEGTGFTPFKLKFGRKANIPSNQN